MLLECGGCGAEFDTEREHPAGSRASTSRCPRCGTDHDVPEPDRSGTDVDAGEVVRIETADGTVIEVTPGGDE